MDEQNVSNNRFGMWKKWFWIGIVISIVNALTGLIYGIALAMEKDSRKEGIVIIVFAVIWFVIWLMTLPMLTKLGILPQYQLVQVK